jgi:hypothetical protein
MTETNMINHHPNSLPCMRVFELIPGSEYMVFFAASEEDLPDDNVRRELKLVAIRNRDQQKRSLLGTVIADIVAGAIGGAAWDSIKATFTATAAYLKRKHGTPTTDAATVLQRIQAASNNILGPAPGPVTAKVRQLDDRRWDAEFARHGISVKATLDPGGTIIKWSQRTGK